MPLDYFAASHRDWRVDVLYRMSVISIVTLTIFLIVKTYSASIVLHFNYGGYLLDSGWFAFLFGSADPWLANPQSIHTETFYQHHMSPLIALWSAVFSGLLDYPGIQSFMIFTVFCGLLIYLPFVILALSRGEKQATKIIILLVGGVFSLTSQFVVAALGYPHYEIVFIGASGALYLTLFAKRYWLALLLASMMVLSREDGGFYVAYAALCALFTQSAGILHPASRPLYGFILIGVLLSLCILAAKAVYFPGFATVEGNFIGDGFSHLTMGLIAKRIQNLFESAGTLPFLLLLPIVALRFPRATIPFLLMLPLVFLHLISVREVIGNFELHYGIPFAVIMIVMLIQILDSLERSGNKALDLSVVVLLVVVSSAPFAAGFDLRNQSGSYFYWIFWRDWPNRDYLDDQRFIRQTVATQTGVTCGSIGVLALEPDLFAVDDFIRDSVHDHCDGLLLYENDLAYDRLRPIVEAEGFYLVGSINKSLHFQKE